MLLALKRLTSAALLTVSLLVTCSVARADEGCPARQFPATYPAKCVDVSASNRLPLRDDMPMRFEAIQLSMVIIWIQATGTITPETPNEFKKFLSTHDGRLSKNLSLHSPGGNLVAGLELGQMIRKAGLNTTIGHSLMLEGLMNVYSYKRAYCMSACAYAFLGGVTRSYTDEEAYGVHRFGMQKGTDLSGDQAQVISSIVAKYIESMGVDLSVFELASTTSFDTDIHRIPVSLARRMHVIYDPSGITQFVVEQRNGTIVASFHLKMRERDVTGVITCSQRERLLIIVDTSNTFPLQLREVKGFPARFQSPVGLIHGTGTYVQAINGQPGAMVFSLPSLTEAAFAAPGISLDFIDNPNVAIPTKAPMSSSAFFDRITWVDAVYAFSFGMQANNAAQTLPIIFDSCH